MSYDVNEWLANPAVGADWQDMDLVLADVRLLARLKSYLSDPAAPERKKVEVISALLELLEHEWRADGGDKARELAEDIRSTLRQHSRVCTAALGVLGPVKDVVLRNILGLPIPADYPKWVIERAQEEGGA